MPLVVQKAQVADIPRLLDIFYHAFHDDPLDRIMFPQIPSPDARMGSTKRWVHEISADPNMSFIEVVDTDRDDEIVAFARWHVFRTERPEGEWMDMTHREWDGGTNVEAANEFHDAVRRKRQKTMGGRPHCCLNLLATDPKHQRRGAGRLLLKWGTDVADDSKILPCYLEASEMGHPLYRSMGFEDVETLDMDLEKWGGKGVHHHFVMVRPAKTS